MGGLAELGDLRWGDFTFFLSTNLRDAPHTWHFKCPGVLTDEPSRDMGSAGHSFELPSFFSDHLHKPLHRVPEGSHPLRRGQAAHLPLWPSALPSDGKKL